MSYKRGLFLIFFLGVFAIFGGAFLWAFLIQKPSYPKPAIPAQPLSQEEKEVTFFLSPSASQAAVGKNFPLEIKFKGEGLRLSGVTARLTYKFSQELPLKPLGEKARVNPSWVEKGWVYPVNKVWIDWENKMVVIELAAVNPTITGFSAVEEETLATLDFIAQTPFEDLTIGFDSSQTKLVTKEGEEFKLNLEKGVYKIY